MADLHVARPVAIRKPLSVVGTENDPRQGLADAPKRTRRARLCPTQHLTLDQFVRLLACIEDGGGIVTLDDISRAMPQIQRPVSAVFDLCDAGILNVDWESALDADMRVWRVDR